MIKMYGINNCDTIKKAKKYLDAHAIAYEFHDYKKHGVDADFLKDMIAEHGVETVVNKRGTTFRKLSQTQKASLNADNAPDLLAEHTSMIKRPILVTPKYSLVGFNEQAYAEALDIEQA